MRYKYEELIEKIKNKLEKYLWFIEEEKIGSVRILIFKTLEAHMQGNEDGYYITPVNFPFNGIMRKITRAKVISMIHPRAVKTPNDINALNVLLEMIIAEIDKENKSKNREENHGYKGKRSKEN